jgi:hypothetical protein
MARASVAWRKVLSFLEAVESERSVRGLLAATLRQLEVIVPFDHAAAVATTADSLIDPAGFVVLHLSL